MNVSDLAYLTGLPQWKTYEALLDKRIEGLKNALIGDISDKEITEMRVRVWEASRIKRIVYEEIEEAKKERK